MNIRPMDLQVLIPRATDISKVQQNANQQVAVDQQLLGEQLKQLTEHRQHQVQQLLQPEGGKVTQNKKKEAKQEQQKKQNVKPQHQLDSDSSEKEVILNRPSPDDPLRGHSIDIIT